jgi:hypothetical protein
LLADHEHEREYEHPIITMSTEANPSGAFITLGGAEPLPLELLQSKVQGERRYGINEDGSQKRILLNAFDMNGVGHIR